jgi:hypothetical protein
LLTNLRSFSRRALASSSGVLLSLISLTLPVSTIAQTAIHGRVLNGTTSLPSANQLVELLSIGQGMKVEHQTPTGPDGSFRFPPVELGQSPHLIIRAIFRGVNYNLSVASAQEMKSPLSLTVYDTTPEFRNLKISLPIVLAQASGNDLLVQQQYFVNNETNPPKTLVNNEGTFFFDTPPSGSTSELSVSVVGLAGIPLPQTPSAQPGGGYFISYPMKPGLNEIRVSYRMSSPTSDRSFKHRLFNLGGASRILVLPSDLHVSGPKLRAAGQDPGTQAAVYQLSSLAGIAHLELEISGSAPEATEPGAGGAPEGGEQPSDMRVVRLHNQIYRNKELILGGVGIFFVVVLFFAFRQRARDHTAK